MLVLNEYNGQLMTDPECDEFGNILLKFGIPYIVESFYLMVGHCEPDNRYEMYISVLRQHSIAMLHQVCPILQACNVSFKVLKNNDLVDQSNGMLHGISTSGKTLTIFPKSAKDAAWLAQKIEKLTKDFHGQFIKNCQRIGQILYYPLNAPALPYTIPKQYRIKRRKGLIGKYYLPIKLIRFNPKGDIMMGVNFRKMAITPCLIKQARANAYEDLNGRKPFHRLIWQKSVIENLGNTIPVPGIIDLCIQDEDYYLITEFIEGPSLSEMVRTLHQDTKWGDLKIPVKIDLLHLFRQAVLIVEKIHAAGYIHRDIQINNFLINRGKLYIIDFELSYNFIDHLPRPAYSLGTKGFVSPEQTEGKLPQTGEDIFSLGAVLAYMIINPVHRKEFSDNIYDDLLACGIENKLLALISGCLQENPINRPNIPAIKDALTTIISNINDKGKS